MVVELCQQHLANREQQFLLVYPFNICNTLFLHTMKQNRCRK